jgi:hypothetical protein
MSTELIKGDSKANLGMVRSCPSHGSHHFYIGHYLSGIR